MDRKEIYEKLISVFKDVFDDDSIEINDSTTSSDIEDWDSLEQIHLIVGIEKSFNIKFVLDELVNLNKVGDIVDLIEKKISNERI